MPLTGTEHPSTSLLSDVDPSLLSASSDRSGDMAMFMTSNGLTAEDVIERGADLSFPESLVGFLRGDLQSG